MTEYSAIKRYAKISAALSAVYIIGALIIIIAPRRAVALIAPFAAASESVVIPLTVYLCAAAFAVSISAAIMLLKGKGIYAPLVMSIISAGATGFFFITDIVQTYITVHLMGAEEISMLGALRAESELLYPISWVGMVMCIAAAAVYAYIRRREINAEYAPPVKGWKTAAAVMLGLYIFLAVLMLAGQNLLMRDVPESLSDVGFCIPSSFAVHIIIAAVLLYCLIKGKPKAVIFTSAFYPVIAESALIAENNILSRIDINRYAYCATLNCYDEYIAFLCGIGALLCTAAAAVERSRSRITANELKGNYDNEEII